MPSDACCRETKALARAGLRNPATVSVAVRSKAGAPGAGAGAEGAPGLKTQATPSSLENFYIVCGPEEKLAQLVGFLQVKINRPRQRAIKKILKMVLNLKGCAAGMQYALSPSLRFVLVFLDRSLDERWNFFNRASAWAPLRKRWASVSTHFAQLLERTERQILP